MHRYPLPLIAIAVAAGMFGSWACELPGWIWSSVFATFAVSALVLRRYANLSALSVLASCFALGGTLHHQRLTEPPSADHLVRLVGKPLVSVVFTIDERRRRDDGVELSVRASARYHAGHLLAARGRFRLFVPTRFRPHGQPLVPGSHWVARLR
ncbi:MAG: hypothetical protein KC609_01605, partial [Myxococcales bacterium]|nr:hypothetical protein [Myxococcales bacterium]